ncbi:hypothetical protein BRAS3843_1110001 [Bradyrhizobium sp. STM 3843]|nr:hypothetical protein BRAS3843_1110001 [Bradyrhizobium sp. STM 3843]
MVSYTHPASTGGAYRDRHETWEGDAMGAVGRSVADVAPTNDPLRTAKSCGPGLPVLRPSFADDDLRSDGGNQAGPRGDHV